jgi:hypothetical protein
VITTDTIPSSKKALMPYLDGGLTPAAWYEVPNLLRSTDLAGGAPGSQG